MPTTTGIVQSIALQAWEQTFAGPPHQFGPSLSFDEFADQVLLLFEDISGFEVISDSESQTIINQLWSDYHGQDK